MEASSLLPRLAAVAFFLSSSLASAQCEFDKILASDAGVGTEFGRSVAMFGIDAAVGRLNGQVNLYRRLEAQWVLDRVLVPAAPEIGDSFGAAVGIARDLVIAGAPRRDVAGQDSGAAFLFERVGAAWLETAMLVPSDPLAYAQFGDAVAVTRDVAVVGAHQRAGFQGAVYVFERVDPGTPLDPLDDAWVETARLAADEAPAAFGTSLAIAGERILVGAPLADEAGVLEAGAAYVFERAGGAWTKVARFVAPDAVAFDHLGQAVALAGDAALVGVPEDDDGGPSTGSVRELALQGGVWVQQTNLVAFDPGVYDAFGSAVFLGGDRAVVGAPYDDDHGIDSGSAYLFARTPAGWSSTGKLAPADGTAYARFGSAVARDATTLFLAADRDPESAMFAGAVYVFAALCGAPRTMSVAAGGTHTLKLAGGPELAGDFHLVLASASGAAPGFAYAGLHVPLVIDDVFLWTLAHAGRPPIAGYLGVLDGAGAATVDVELPAGMDPALAGTTLDFAFGALDIASWTLAFVSNPESLTFLP